MKIVIRKLVKKAAVQVKPELDAKTLHEMHVAAWTAIRIRQDRELYG